MRHNDRKKEKDKVAVALMLCFCVIALTTIFTIKSNVEKINNNHSDLTVSDPLPSEKNPDETEPPAENSEEKDEREEDKEKESQEVHSQTPIVDSQDSKEESNPPTKSLPYGSPLKSSQAYVLNPFSMDSLVYSVTLDQYMVHSGVDLAAPADTQVLAMSPGLVTAIYEDDRYGYTVEVTQDDGLMAVYSNLSNASMVEVGDQVSTGTILGGVGSSGLFESLESPHLHLELLKDNAYLDPLDYITVP